MSYTHLTGKERYVINHLKSTKFSLREIARRLSRHYTSISREIKRNGPTYFPNTAYWKYFSKPVAYKRKHTDRSHHRQKYLPLVKYVDEKLKLEW
ncbi:MAG: helix-turn-helix domain-containing protein [Geobacteraceae bacterium]|nr:helix-turn-helix domain-containing protein [Geobacteraceae bacterium]